MSITKEQINQFKEHPIPNGLKLTHCANFSSILRGKEALLTKVVDPSGKNWAFKWYANLSGKTSKELSNYAEGVNKDETSLRELGLTKGQVPNSDFWVGQFDNNPDANPQLFALQPWTQGRPLRDIPVEEILNNRRLRKNLGALFILCGRLYDKEGVTPDLTGGKRINLFGHDVVDPTGFIWPFRTTNVIIKDNTPVIVDAKHNSPDNHLTRLAVLTNRRISQLIGQIMFRV